MGGGTETVTNTVQSQPTNPKVTETTNLLLSGLQGAYNTGVKPFGQSLYVPSGATTQQGWQGALSAANNPIYSQGIQGAMSDFGDIAAGKRFGMNDPGYATLRQNVIDDTMANINSTFTNSGRFGGGSHLEGLGEGVGNAVAGLDYANFQNDQQRQLAAAGMLPGLFQGSLAPSAAIGAVGSAQDADANAIRQGENDLFRRLNDADWDRNARASSILAGTAGTSGTTTTSSETSPATPWWQTALGIGIGGAGLLGRRY